MGKVPDNARRGPERRTFSIERHMRRSEGAGSALGVGAVADAGELGCLVADIRAMRSEMRALNERLDGVEELLKEAAERPAEPPIQPTTGHRQGILGDDAEAQLLRIEIARMVRSLATAKREIAEIKHPMAEPDEDRMVRAANELDAIVAATETATNTIMDSAEAIMSQTDSLLGEVGDFDSTSSRLNEISAQASKIFEACNFQDITGQRITKVVKTLEFIEDRIRAIVEEWGRDAFLDLPLPQDDEHLDEESKLLNGPQLENQGLSQNDIDSLFD